MSSLYLHGVSAAPPSSGYGDPYPLFLTPQPPPPRSYSSELVSLYGNDLSSSWNTEPHPLEPPLLSTVKRPAEEALFDGDIMSKQARVDSVSNLHAYPQRSGEKYCAFYMRTRTCSFGANCKYDHPTWVPIGGIPDWNEASAPKSNSGLPVHPGEPDCVFFSKTGLSKYGSKCLFNHPIDTSIKLSGKKSPENVTHETAVATISSMAANDTVYARVSALGVSRDEGGGNAPPKAATAFNAKGFPLRPGGSDCAFYMKKGR